MGHFICLDGTSSRLPMSFTDAVAALFRGTPKKSRRDYPFSAVRPDFMGRIADPKRCAADLIYAGRTSSPSADQA